MMIEVKLDQPLKVTSADDEIITMAGWDLGFITPGKPLHVLHVEPGAAIAAHGVQSNDLLISIDGTNVVSIPKNDITKSLEAAKSLNFERSEMADDEEAEVDFGAKDPMDIDLGDTLEPAADAPASVPAAQAPTSGGAEGSGDAIMQDASNTAATSSTDGSALETGMQVKLKGISESMNGKHGRLGKFSDKTGCWQVFLENTSAAKAVRPQNLEVVPATESVPDAPGGSSTTTPAGANGTPSDGQPPASSTGTGGTQPIAARQLAPRSAVPDLPPDHDMDAWVELLRDAYMRQMRSDNEYPEPPPFDQANRFGVSHGQSVPEGHFPSQALKQQQQMLHRSYHGEGTKPGMPFMGGGMNMMGQIGNMMNMMGMMPRRGGRGAGPGRFMSPFAPGGML